MKLLKFLFLSIGYYFVCSFQIPSFSTFSDNSTGMDCLVCTVTVKTIQLFMEWHKLPCEKVIESFCDLIPDTPEWIKYREFCQDILDFIAPVACLYIEEGISSDVTCRKIKFCQGWEQCTLFKDFENTENVIEKKYHNEVQRVWKSLKNKIFSKVGDVLIPDWKDDHDGDYFATYMYHRGYSWRGRDCNDENNNIYPGRKVNPSEKGTDYNCNGIKGIDVDGVSFEDKLCGNSSRLGLVIIGDSMCAHFRVPEQWFQPNMTFESLKYLFPLIENEIDWPHLGMYAGFMNDTITGLNPAPVHSLNMVLKNRNRCNHRDYQLVCHNGAASSDVSDYIKFISRKQDLDHPLLLLVSLVANDVCDRNPDISKITTPKEFYDRILKSLQNLDEQIPSGSHVVFVGLLDGLVYWKFLKEKIHPLGATYSDIYNYLNCLEQSAGWLQKNETIRERTQNRANELSQQYSRIIKEYTFKNFDMYYLDFVNIIDKGIDMFVKKGLDPALFFEPFDGFHPSQWSEGVIIELMVNELEKMNPKSMSFLF